MSDSLGDPLPGCQRGSEVLEPHGWNGTSNPDPTHQRQQKVTIESHNATSQVRAQRAHSCNTLQTSSKGTLTPTGRYTTSQTNRLCSSPIRFVFCVHIFICQGWRRTRFASNRASSAHACKSQLRVDAAIGLQSTTSHQDCDEHNTTTDPKPPSAAFTAHLLGFCAGFQTNKYGTCLQ
jgi:hypothetical protein